MEPVNLKGHPHAESGSRQVLRLLWLGLLRLRRDGAESRASGVWCLSPPLVQIFSAFSTQRKWSTKTDRQEQWERDNSWGTSCSKSGGCSCSAGLSEQLLWSIILSWFLRPQIPELCCLTLSAPVPNPATWLQGSRTNQPTLAVSLPVMFDSV